MVSIMHRTPRTTPHYTTHEVDQYLRHILNSDTILQDEGDGLAAEREDLRTQVATLTGKTASYPLNNSILITC